MINRMLTMLITVGLGSLATLSNAQDYTNKLTPVETASGYDLLFNGTDFKGWHGYKMTTIPDAWLVKTNTPLGTRIENGNGNKQYLMTDKKYKNFDLKLEVQVPASANSGIFIRYEENASSPGDHRSGPETQVCGSSDVDCASPVHFFGACYDMFPPKIQNWYNPSGQWNQLRIIAYDSNIVHYGNGKKLVDYKIGSAEFLAAYAKSKYASDGNNGRYYDIHPGSVMLQHHGEIGVTFRNMRAKELTANPLKEEFKDGKWPDTLSMNSVFGATTALRTSGPSALPGITAAYAGPGAALVTVSGDHGSFEAMGIDGRAIPFRKTPDGSYLVERGTASSGIAIVRIRAAGGSASKIIDLP
ncbi:MAG: hypothetical protein JWP91_3711 [Fibrobacteres bacterium]|nr:hypothetical protein [Fibrobacterota bacterium]